MGRDKFSEPPTPGRLGQPRPLKFRASCDACSSSKVKCDQGRPNCLRCSKLGTKCHYSLSRRMGKPPEASRDLQKAKKSDLSTTSEKPPLKVQGQDVDTPVKSIPFNQNLPISKVNRPESECLISVPWEADGSNPLNWSSRARNAALTVVDMFDQDQDLLIQSTCQQFVQSGSADQGLVFDDSCMGSISASFSNTSHSGLQGSADPMFLPMIKPESSSPLCDCASLASSTLHNLDYRVWDVVSPTKTALSTLPIDRILINNKAAIEDTYRILACPCSLKPGFFLTITLICYHIIERYEAIVVAGPATHSPSGPPTSSSANLPSARMTVGEYQIDGEDEQRMRIQLVVNELRKVRRLVDQYGERYCTGLYGDKERHEGIYSALETFLMSKLKDTVNDMINTLQN